MYKNQSTFVVSVEGVQLEKQHFFFLGGRQFSDIHHTASCISYQFVGYGKNILIFSSIMKNIMFA